MRCRVCGGLLEPRVTDLPFKISDSSVVILKALPVLQCRQCGETEMEHAPMLHVDPSPSPLSPASIRPLSNHLPHSLPANATPPPSSSIRCFYSSIPTSAVLQNLIILTSTF